MRLKVEFGEKGRYYSAIDECPCFTVSVLMLVLTDGKEACVMALHGDYRGQLNGGTWSILGVAVEDFFPCLFDRGHFMSDNVVVLARRYAITVIQYVWGFSEMGVGVLPCSKALDGHGFHLFFTDDLIFLVSKLLFATMIWTPASFLLRLCKRMEPRNFPPSKSIEPTKVAIDGQPMSELDPGCVTYSSVAISILPDELCVCGDLHQHQV